MGMLIQCTVKPLLMATPEERLIAIKFYGLDPMVEIDKFIYLSNTVETGLLAHALMGSIAELYALIFENALIIQ